MKKFVQRHWIYLFLTVVTLSTAQAQRLVNPNATANTRALKAFIDDSYRTGIISGQYWERWCTWVRQQTGQTPAILGLDFMDYTPRRLQEGARPTDTETAINWYNNRNGIVTFSWHWDAPMDIYDASFRQECQGTTGGDARWYKAFYSCATYFDLNAALNSPGSARYNAIIRDIDLIAVQLRRLQDAGVPVLWRPLHEASGRWFWWGAQGPGPCKRLWSLIYDRLTNHHQLNNLIWVWNCYGNEHGNPYDWYPGDNMVDIIAYDYPRTSSWSEYNTIHGNRNKPFALAEVGGLPDPNNFAAQSWSYFVTWGDFIQNNNSLEYVRRVYNDPRVINLEDLPDLKTYLGVIKPGNLAYNRPVTVSSTETGSVNVGARAVDGRSSTRWSSAYADPQWIQVDLGATYQVQRVYLSWEAAHARAYRIETSIDGTQWNAVYQTTTGDGGIDDITSLTGLGRYVRITGTQRSTTWGYSLFEIEVYGSRVNTPPSANAGTDINVTDSDRSGMEQVSLNGSASRDTDGTISSYQWTINNQVIATTAQANVNLPVGSHSITLTVTDNSGATASDIVLVTITEGAIVPPTPPAGTTNLALNRPVTVSSTEAGFGNVAARAVDGSTTTRWSSIYADPQWIQVDLGARYTIQRVQLLWEAAFARAYRIEVSDNGSTWTTAFQTTTGDGATDNITGLTATGRFVRVFGTQRATTWGYSLFEFQVFGLASTMISLEAESALLTGVSTATAVPGFSGSGYVQGLDASTDNLRWNVTVPSAGNYRLRVIYQTPWGAKINDVYVNNQLIQSMEFPPVTTWSGNSIPSIALQSGQNVIEIRSNWGWFLVDRIELEALTTPTPVTPTAVSSSFTFTGFPNPVLDVYSIQVQSQVTVETIVSVLRMDGTTASSQSFQGNDGIQIDLSGLPTGLYIVQVTRGTERRTALIQKL
ncbi:MAG: discoidin domain-containing protein [Cytophagaceae bacterium]|jgi:hypothetical protein|nr:discoidin domain-containing protein [Cytophagaceae bacterium]